MTVTRRVRFWVTVFGVTVAVLLAITTVALGLYGVWSDDQRLEDNLGWTALITGLLCVGSFMGTMFWRSEVRVDYRA